MDLSRELKSLDELHQSGFIHEEEYQRRRQTILSQKEGAIDDLIQQSSGAATFTDTSPPKEKKEFKTPTLDATVAGPKMKSFAAALSEVATPAAPKVQYVNEVNPFIYTEDYSKYTTPVVFVSKEGWTKEKTNDREPEQPSEDLIARWKALQNAYAERVRTSNQFEWTTDVGKPNTLKLIGGLDISFPKGNKIDAVVCLAVCTYPDNRLIFVAYKMIKLTAPYVAGLLNFREAPYYEATLTEVKKKYPQFMPQVLILDGNGIIHPRACGVACQLGVVTGIPAFGCAKKLLVFDGLDLDTIVKSFDHTDKRWVDMRGTSGKIHGRAFKFDEGSDPIFVSAGHKISLETCQIICDQTAISREPEAVNQADLLGREWLNKNYRNL